MPRMNATSFLAVLGLIAAGGMVVGLPWLRSMRWRDTQTSTKRLIPAKTPEEIEEERLIEQAATIDESDYAQDRGIRYLKRIPTTKVALEAAFRQRRSDAALMLNASETLYLSRFVAPNKSLKNTTSPTDADKMLSTRRAVFSIGLDMRDADISTLPWLSRSSILSFIKAHYVSLQANIQKDASSGEWFLHHRPVAGLAKFGGVPLTQNFVSPITETVGDIRGLGTYLHQETIRSSPTATDQTAVWLFRSLRMEETVQAVHYEYAFVRTYGDDPDDLQVKVILTSNNRSEWCCLPKVDTSRPPLRGSDTTTLGTVHFVEYASDGLHPKTSVTRSVRIKSTHVYKQAEIDDYLASKNLQGDWGTHLGAILDFVAPNNAP